MAERFPGDGAAANGLDCRHLHEDEARLLYEADYPTPLDMRVSGSWLLSADEISVPPSPSGADWRAKIARIRSLLPESSSNLLRYAPNSNTPWTAYFERQPAEQLAATNGVEPRGRHNSKGHHPWRGILGRTLDVVLEHIEGGNSPRLEYPPPPTFSRRSDSSWTPRRMKTASSSSFGSSSHSSGSPALLPVKPEPRETPLGWRTRSGSIVINEPRACSRLIKSKTEPGHLLVKQELLAMAAGDETALNGSGATTSNTDFTPTSPFTVILAAPTVVLVIGGSMQHGSARRVVARSGDSKPTVTGSSES
ncbi:Homeobox protein KNOX3 [Hordeum vulgare]|nr:Homeobox protein KNOX3 [Hordeum vulgare]